MSEEQALIVPYQDGPYLVRGPVQLRDQTGAEIEADRAVIALCRCGKSRLRPFCDGSHHLVRFRAPSGRELRGLDPAPGTPDPTDTEGEAGTASRTPSAAGRPCAQDPASDFPTSEDADLETLEHEIVLLRQRLLARSSNTPGAGVRQRLASASRLMAQASAALRDAPPSTTQERGQ